MDSAAAALEKKEQEQEQETALCQHFMYGKQLQGLFLDCGVLLDGA